MMGDVLTHNVISATGDQYTVGVLSGLLFAFPAFLSVSPLSAVGDVGIIVLLAALLAASPHWNDVTLRALVSGAVARLPVLFDLVRHVVGCRTKPQVRRVNAASVIARVANEQALRDRPPREHVGDPVCNEHSATPLEVAVSRLVYVACPLPAPIRPLHFRPESFGGSGLTSPVSRAAPDRAETSFLPLLAGVDRERRGTLQALLGVRLSHKGI
jgi:hypothetical protein